MPKSIKANSTGGGGGINGARQLPTGMPKKTASSTSSLSSLKHSQAVPPPPPPIPTRRHPPPPPPPSSATSSRTSPASPSFPSIGTTQLPREASHPDGEADFEPAPPAHIFGSSHGGFRSNFMRSVRDRSGTIKEEGSSSNGLDATTRKVHSSSPVPPTREGGGGLFSSSRNRRAGDGSGGRGGASGRKQLNGSTASEPRSPTPEDDRSFEQAEPWKEKRRGSMIKNLGHKAKTVLPMKRSGKDQSSKVVEPATLQVKPSTSASSLQSAQSGYGQTRYNDTTSESDEELEVEKEDNETLKGRMTTASTRDLRLPLQSPVDTPPMSPGIDQISNGKAAMRPKSVPTRVSSTTATSQNEAYPPHQGVVKRSNKIMQMSPEDLQPTSPTIDMVSGSQGPAPTPLKPPTPVNRLGPSAEQSRRTMASSSASSRTIRPSASAASLDQSKSTRNRSASQPHQPDRPGAPRSTSAIKISSNQPRLLPSSKPSTPLRAPLKPPTTSPPLPHPDTAPRVDVAPPNGMYWSKAPTFGHEPNAIRAHTATLVGNSIFVFGGCDARTCFNSLYVLDADCMAWSSPQCSGDVPPPLRAMTTTAVGKKLVIFGGGDGPSYYNDVYVLDTLNFRYTKPVLVNPMVVPAKRRAHAACLYKTGIYVFGGGDGGKALNDVWRLDVADLTKPSWALISAASSSSVISMTSKIGTAKARQHQPTARGYHTANMVGSKLIIYGGSDGSECFRDVWVLDVEAASVGWRLVEVKQSFPRLSHSATVVGSYLFVVGGHDGGEYSSDVLLLNLVTMQWDRRKVYGKPPSGRGYHGAVLHDSRLFVIGGFDGHTVFEDTYMLELAVSAYYSQISHFSIDV
ncbi:MAG: hypothetical protein M1814_005907 [Vezdaea aestivalis]|nr:MAG: hypothetical protein M1814_005907 [Vezdaea aestivalis]